MKPPTGGPPMGCRVGTLALWVSRCLGPTGTRPSSLALVGMMSSAAAILKSVSIRKMILFHLVVVGKYDFFALGFFFLDLG